MVSNSNYSIGQFAETSFIVDLATKAIMSSSGGGYPIILEISSDGSNWSTTGFINTTTKQHKFVLATSNISITILA